MFDKSKPTHFRQLRVSTNLPALDSITLDNLACQLMAEIDKLETYGRDQHGNWWSKIDYKSHAKWSKYLAAVNVVLDSREEI
jgi:hypothetical protein